MTNKIVTPQAKDWNNYWSLDQTKKFTKTSWSKKRIINVLLKYLKQDGYALDAGCGSGFFSKFFCDQGLNATALDYSEGALTIAKEMTEGKVKTLCCDLLQPGLENKIEERFDLIFTDGLFEHFPKDHQDIIYQNFFNVLKPDGVIVTFVPNRWSPWELIRPFYMPGIEEDPFVLKELIHLNERNKMSVIDRGGLNTFPFAFSPDKLLGSLFGMLLYTIAKKK
jgi:SAM-dependent methyltransferase